MDRNLALNKKIAVVTARERVAAFFSLEARACGRVSEVMTTLPEDISDYGVLIVDEGADKRTPDRLSGRVRITLLNDDDVRDELIDLPVEVNTISSFFWERGCVLRDSEMRCESNPYVHIADEDSRTVFYRNRKFTLTEGEWRVLLLLGKTDGAVVSRDELLELFGETGSNIADVYVCNLRRKLEAPFGIKLIGTVRGKGYTLLTKIKN